MSRKLVYLLFSLLFAFSSQTLACGSDAECANDEICNDAGRCVPDGRDWKALKNDLNNAQQSQSGILLKLLEQNNRTLNILEKNATLKRTCSISCSGNG
jgi:hypothetical protein